MKPILSRYRTSLWFHETTVRSRLFVVWITESGNDKKNVCQSVKISYHIGIYFSLKNYNTVPFLVHKLLYDSNHDSSEIVISSSS